MPRVFLQPPQDHHSAIRKDRETADSSESSKAPWILTFQSYPNGWNAHLERLAILWRWLHTSICQEFSLLIQISLIMGHYICLSHSVPRVSSLID